MATPKRSRRQQAPLLLLGLHRGGTTYTQRILNCHRRVVVWGENGGLVSHLRRGHDRAHNLSQTDAVRYQEFDAFAAKFIPWASRVDQAGLRLRMAAFVRELHRAEAPNAFWGFKEIRHGNRRDLRFLRSLFPDARIVLLVRHPRDVLRSEIHVAWSPRRRTDPALRARRFVKRYVRVVTAFLESAAEHRELTRLITYESLLGARAIRALFSWLRLELGASDLSRIRDVRAARVGSSFSDAGRAVDATLVEDVIAAFDEEMASTLRRLDSGVRDALLRWYPDLAGSSTREWISGAGGSRRPRQRVEPRGKTIR